MLDKLVKKIRALQAKAESTTSEAESAAFAAKVAELLAEYNLDPSVLNSRTEEEETVQKRPYIHVNNGGWRTMLVVGVSRLYFCRIVTSNVYENGKPRLAYNFIGKPHNVEIAQSMYDYLEKTTLRLAKAYSSDRGARLRFEKGCGAGLASRLADKYEQMKSGRTSEGDGSGLPALYMNEENAVTEFMSGMNLRKGRNINFRTGGNDFYSGREASKTVNLGGQLSGASGRMAIGYRK